jgi:hypothetical protein
MNVIYITCICILLCSVAFLLWKLYKFSIIIINIEDSIEESLDILDQKYKSMNEILQKPVFFDSLEVRQAISDIRDCHTAILVIANKLTNNMGMQGEIKEENIEEDTI